MKSTNPLYPIFLKIIKKHKKPHSLSNKITGNSLCIGNPGAGKTSSNRREVEIRYKLGHKSFNLYDAGRMDMMFFMFSSNHPYWKVPKLERRKIISARSYPTEGLVPVTRGLPQDDKLPNNFKLFTIPVNSLDETDLAALVGEKSSDTVKAAYNYMLDKIDENTTAVDYIKLLQNATRKVGNYGFKDLSHFGPKKLIEDVFRPLVQQGLLSSGNVSTALDLDTIMKDKSTISTLVLRHCPKQYWGFLVAYFMNHINKKLAGFGETKPIRQKTTLTLNEVADLLDTDSDKGSAAFTISKLIANIAKQSRTASGGLYLNMDTQLPSELPEIKETMQRVYVFNSSLPSIQKAMEIIGISSSTGDINSDDFAVIPHLGPGWYYLFDRENGVSVHKLLHLRSREFQTGDNFYDIYDKIIGRSGYQNIKPLLKELENERKLSEEAWKATEVSTNQMNVLEENVIREKEAIKKQKVEEEIQKKIEIQKVCPLEA